MTRPRGIPACYKVGCERAGRHTHVGPLERGERIVVTPKLPTAPGWAYKNPHGHYVSSDGIYAVVALDDGTTRQLSKENLVRERLWHEPVVAPRVPKPPYAPHRPLDEGPWHEAELPLGEDGAA